MAKPKTKVQKYRISVTQKQEDALRVLMEEDMCEDVSQYVGRMIAELTQRRAS